MIYESCSGLRTGVSPYALCNPLVEPCRGGIHHGCEHPAIKSGRGAASLHTGYHNDVLGKPA